jgi:hypothetical protein
LGTAPRIGSGGNWPTIRGYVPVILIHGAIFKISEEPGGFSENWRDIRRTGRIFEYLCSSSKNWMDFKQLHGCSNNRTEFRTTAQLFEELDRFSNNCTVLRKTGWIFEQPYSLMECTEKTGEDLSEV